MQLPIILAAVFSALAILAGAGPSAARDTPDAAALQRAVAAARDEAVAASRLVHDELAALVPSVPGWTCEEEKRPDHFLGKWSEVVPSVAMRCDYEGDWFLINLVLDPRQAVAMCAVIASEQDRLKDPPASNSVRFFEGGAWRLQRLGARLEGCAAESIVLISGGLASEESVARGPAAVDAFAEALLNSDPAPFLAAAEAAGLEAALARLMEHLDAQSRLMEAMLPDPPGARKTIWPMDPFAPPETPQRPHYAAILDSPGVTADITIGDCSPMVRISASPRAIDTAKVVILRRSPPGGGLVEKPSITLNTGRVIGREMVDGTRAEALVDGRTVVSVSMSGNRPCESDPGIVRRLFDEIVANDLSVFGDP